jgi:hypothetical protein
VEASPLTRWLEAMDRRDVENALVLLAPSVDMMLADGRRARGHDAAARVIRDFVSAVRWMTHDVTAQWHVDDVWIAETTATYELADHYRTSALPRVFIVRVSAEGITELRVYGAHEHPLTEHRTGEEGMWVGGRWVPPL